MKHGEDADEALVREVREETGLSADVGPPVQTVTDVWYTDSGEPVFAVVYYCETDGTDVTLDHEHEASEWVSFETARARMPVEPLVVAVERAYDLHR